MMMNLEALTKNAPFRVVFTHEDGSESSIACLTRKSAERVYAERKPKVGLPTRHGPRSVSIEIREYAA
jgi:hypothetical protein